MSSGKPDVGVFRTAEESGLLLNDAYSNPILEHPRLIGKPRPLQIELDGAADEFRVCSCHDNYEPVNARWNH